MTAGWPPTPPPPVPFEPKTGLITVGTVLHRVHSLRLGAVEFNPGFGTGGRFHFFGDPTVPVLYLAETREAAVAETLLRNIPVDKPAPLPRSSYATSAAVEIELRRDLKIAEFFGFGLNQLGVRAHQLTDTPGANYPATRLWAQAVYDAGFDGLAWMSHQLNSEKAYMLFGGRVVDGDLAAIPGTSLPFAAASGFDWLVRICYPLRITVVR